MSSWQVLQVSAPTYLEASGEAAPGMEVPTDAGFLSPTSWGVWPGAETMQRNKTGKRRRQEALDFADISKSLSTPAVRHEPGATKKSWPKNIASQKAMVPSPVW